MKKSLALLVTFVLLLAMAAACQILHAGQTTTSIVTSAASQTTAQTLATQLETQASQPASYPVTVTDQLGRVVTIQQQPERLVSGYYISTSLLIALGLEDKLVGIEAKASQRPIYQKSAPQLLELPNVGTAKDFSMEGTLALKPDLVILPERLRDAIETLSGMGVAVIGVNPETKDLLEEAIRLVGQVTGTSDRATELLATSQMLADKAQNFAFHARASSKEPAKRIYLAGNSDLLSTSGAAMYQSSLLKAAGAENVAAELKNSYWAEISYEQLLAWQPDLIVLVPEASYTVEDVLADPALANLKAIQNKQVYQMPRDFEAWDSPIPSGVLGQLYLASILYPDQYGSSDFDADVSAFYQEYYGF